MTLRRDIAALILPAGLAAMALTSTPAAAEERQGSWEFGFFGGATLYASELQVSNEVGYGLRLGYNFRPAYEVEVQVQQAEASSLQEGDSPLLADPILFILDPDRTIKSRSYSARFLINPSNEKRRFKPYLAFGAGVLDFSADPRLEKSEQGDSHHTKIVTVGGGLRMRLTPHMAGRVELEAQYAPTDIYTDYLLNAGLTWVFGGGNPKDTDEDGVLDLHDQCPDTPKGAMVDRHNGCPWDTDLDGIMEGVDKCVDTPRGWPVDAAGCPLDTDTDGVPDGLDKCTETPKSALVDEAGCPIDSDHDGVPDGIDQCPDTPKGSIVDGLDGATPGCPHDSDKDGVPDGIDQCPLTTPGATVDPIGSDKAGCPRDGDGDRVLDGLDQCPDSPAGAKVDRDGCPRVRLDKPEPQILQNVKFLTGTELYPGTEAWIELLIESLSYWTDLTIEIGAYTDNTGTPSGNKLVAQRRAETLKAWLVNHGIEGKRLVPKGYGAVNFIADNETEEGRNNNRRVEVKRLSGDPRKHPKPAPAEPSPAPEATPAPAPEATPSPAPEPAPGQ